MGKFFAFLIGLPIVLAVIALFSLPLAGVVMLLIGNASIASAGVIPALGYWATWWLTLAILLLVTRPSGS